jgi:hypothetical protein
LAVWNTRTHQKNGESGEVSIDDEDGGPTLNKSDRTKACVVRTGLATNDETYVSIVNDMVVSGMPASQDVLNICLTQASLEMHMKNNK